MKKIKDYIFESKFLNIIMAIISYFMLCKMTVLSPYNLFSWIIFIFLIIIFKKVNIFQKELKWENIFLSLIFSLITIIGTIAYQIMNVNDQSLFRLLFTFKQLINFIGVFNLFYILFIYTLPFLYNYKIRFEKSRFNRPIILFIISFVLIILCWLPYFLNFYPGILTEDSVYELSMAMNISPLSNHHPIIHIFFAGIPFRLGLKIFGQANAAAAFSIIIQMIVMACIFAYTITFFYKKKVNDKILLVLLLYFGLLPMNGYYSVTMWKDVVFSGIVLLLTIELIKLLEDKINKKFKIKNLITFTLVSLLCVFFRNNAIYMYLVLLVLSIIILKKDFKYLIIPFISVLGIYIIVTGPVFNHFGILKSSSSEYLAMPLQQVGRMAYKNVEFTEKQKNELSKFMPFEKWAEAYTPNASDGIKFSPYYQGEYMNDNKWSYLKLWLNLVWDHPSVAMESYIVSTLGFWYPGVEYWHVSSVVVDNPLDIEQRPINTIFKNSIDKLRLNDVPILSAEWSIGLCYWIILLFLVLTIKKRGFNYILPYVPTIGLWLTMMIASPVFAEFRYVYSAFLCLPILIIVFYLQLDFSKNINNDKNKKR